MRSVAMQYTSHVLWSLCLFMCWARVEPQNGSSSIQFSLTGRLMQTRVTMCYRGIHLYNVATMSEPSGCGGNAALCQITLTAHLPF